MNKASIVLATAISIAPAVACAGAGESPLASDASLFTDIPGLGLLAPRYGDPWDEQAVAAFDPAGQRSSPGLHLSTVVMVYSPIRMHDSDRIAPPAAETFSVLLAGVGVMGLIAQRKSRLRLALAR